MTRRQPPAILLWGALALIVLAQTQAALAKDLKDGPFVSGADLFAALLFGAWALWVLATQGWRSLRLPPVAAWAFVVVALFGVGRADSPEALRSGIVDLAQYVLYFLCVYTLFLNVLTTEVAMRRAIWALCAVTGVMVLVALAQYALVASPSSPGDTFRHVHSTFGLGEYLSATGIGKKLHLAGKSSRSIYGNYLVMVLPLLFAIGLYLERRPWVRAALLVTAGLAAVSLLSGWHFWVLAAILLTLALRHSARAALTVAVALIAFVALGPVLFQRNHQANIVEVLDFYETGVLDEKAVVTTEVRPGELPTTTHVKKRWIEWQPALNMLGTSPALGVGTGGYQLHIGQSYGQLPNFEKIEPDTNCGWLVIAASMGLCGLVALAALYYGQYRAALSLWATAADRFTFGVGEGLAGGILGMFLANLLSNVLVRGLSITMVLLLALVSVVGRVTASRADEPADAPVVPRETVVAGQAPQGG
jgi:hypothetical protein